MSTLYYLDPAVFEQERARVGGDWDGYFAKHPDLRGIPGLEFPGTPDQPVSPAGWDSFGLFFDGVAVPSDENKLKIAQVARNWFQLLFIWLHRFSRSCPIDQNFLMAFGNDFAARFDKDPQVCCSVDLFIVIFSFMEARKQAIGRLFDPTGFERLHHFVDECIRETSYRAWVLPNHIHHIVSLIRNQPDNL